MHAHINKHIHTCTKIHSDSSKLQNTHACKYMHNYAHGWRRYTYLQAYRSMGPQRLECPRLTQKLVNASIDMHKHTATMSKQIHIHATYPHIYTSEHVNTTPCCEHMHSLIIPYLSLRQLQVMPQLTDFRLLTF